MASFPTTTTSSIVKMVPVPSSFVSLPSKDRLCEAYSGKPLSQLPTPALIIDAARVKSNSARMQQAVRSYGVDADGSPLVSLRCHIKTHKCAEATKAMLVTPEGSSSAVIVSTLAEAWGVISSGLVKEGVVDDILYGLPVGEERLHELADVHAAMQHNVPEGRQAQLRLIVDNLAQVDFLEKDSRTWSVYVKVDCGTTRAGLPSGSQALKDLLARAVGSSGVNLHGIYAHAGHSYDSRSTSDAASCLTAEIDAVHSAALYVKSLDSSLKLVLSVGSTPTAHAALDSEEIRKAIQGLWGKLELHAGNYPLLDLQQIATRAVQSDGTPSTSAIDRAAMTVLTSIISVYPGRGKDGTDEAMCNAGGIAMSKDKGPFGGNGHVLFPRHLRGWELQRISQEHGVLGLRPGCPEDWEKQWKGSSLNGVPATPVIGDRVRVVPQHACMTASAHPWYYVIDSELDAQEGVAEGQEIVRDVWVPWKGW